MTAARLAYRDVVVRRMQERNAASASFFSREADRLARLCHRMSERFQRGGRLLALGTGPCMSDAQHVAVEFVHPILAGKRALPALDLSAGGASSMLALLRSDDIVMAFGPPRGDPAVDAALRDAMARGAVVVALPGASGDYAVAPPSEDPFIHQELMEILYHTLWETVHVFLDRRSLASDAGAASFLYPFLGAEQQLPAAVFAEVAGSIRSKADQSARLRDAVADEQGEELAAAVDAMAERIAAGGTILCFGNGGSATDATDFAADLVMSPKGYAAVPAISLSAEPATLTAIANDIGADAMFERQIIAYGRPEDVAFAVSTSGGSRGIIAALAEARARGLVTVALLGYDGGDVLRQGLADHPIVVRSDQIPRVQEVHASIYHVMADLLGVIRTAT